MRLIFILIFLLATTQSCAQKYHFTPKHSAVLDTNKAKNLLKQCSRTAPGNISSYYTVSSAEVILLEQNYKKLQAIPSSGCCLLGYKLKNLDKYGYQYLGIVIDGKKCIYINAFKIENEDELKISFKEWETEPIKSCDGGSSFWGAIFSLNDEEFKDLCINGVS